MNSRRVSLLVACLVLILVATLSPQPSGRVDLFSPFCLTCGDLGAPDLILNLLLFLPLGMALGGLGVSFWRAVAIGLVLSSSIEAAQLFIPGRYSTLRDALANALGCGLGVLVPSAISQLLRPSRWSAYWLWSAASVAILSVLATGWLLRFDPSSGALFVHWSPRQAHLEPWSGTVLGASIAGRPIERGPAADPAAIRELLRDSLRLRVQATGGEPTVGLGGIVTISDEGKQEVMLAGPSGDDLVVRMRRRAARFRFDAPRVTYPGLLAAAAPTAPFELEVQMDWTGGCASVGAQQGCVKAVSAGSAWMLIRSFPSLGAAWRSALSALTLLLLVLPVGALLGSVSRRQGAVAAVVTVVGVSSAAAGAGLGLPTPVEWIGLIGGLGMGLIARRAVI